MCLDGQFHGPCFGPWSSFVLEVLSRRSPMVILYSLYSLRLTGSDLILTQFNLYSDDDNGAGEEGQLGYPALDSVVDLL